jgi:hypothetical protein
MSARISWTLASLTSSAEPIPLLGVDAGCCEPEGADCCEGAGDCCDESTLLKPGKNESRQTINMMFLFKLILPTSHFGSAVGEKALDCFRVAR